MPVSPGTVGLLERGQHEHRGLEPFAEHGEERHHDETDRRALHQRDRRALLEIALEVGGVATHPDDHPGDHPDRDQRDDRLELLLLPLRQVLLGDVERVRHAAAEQHRSRHAEPHPPQRVAATLLAEEGGDDPDDQRRLEALPQTDDEGGKHDPKVRNPLA